MKILHRSNQIKPQWRIGRSLTIVLLLAGCGVFAGNPDDDDDEGSPPPTVRGTGGETASGIVQLGLARVQPVVAGLLAQAPTITLANGIVVDFAKVHMGRFKIKSTLDVDANEQQVNDDVDNKQQEQDQKGEGQEGNDSLELDAIESKYDGLIADASNQDERHELEQQEQNEKLATESSIAEAEAAQTNEVEAFEDAVDDSTKWPGTYVYDIVNDVVTPSIPQADVAGGAYPRIEFKAKPSHSTTENLDIINSSIVVRGSVEVGGSAVPFQVRLRETVEFSLKGAGELTVSPGQLSSLLIRIDIAEWFAGVDFASAIKNVRNEIEISAVENRPLYDAIIKNLKASTQYGSDDNGDGQLGSDESDGYGQSQVDEEG